MQQNIPGAGPDYPGPKWGTYIFHVEECTTARQSRKKLKIFYAEPSTPNRMRLYEKLLTHSLNGGENGLAHVNQPARTWTQLRQVRVGIDETQ